MNEPISVEQRSSEGELLCPGARGGLQVQSVAEAWGGVRGYLVEQREQRAESPSVYLQSSSEAQFPDCYLRKGGHTATLTPSPDPLP